MEYYVLTQLGKDAILVLQKAGKDNEASILEYLSQAGGATVEQVADTMHLDEKTARDKLRSLSANRWVWRKTTKLTPF